MNKQTKKIKQYAVRCPNHWPGYEIFCADNRPEAISIIRTWIGCEISYEMISDTLHVYKYKSTKEKMLLDSWQEIFELK